MSFASGYFSCTKTVRYAGKFILQTCICYIIFMYYRVVHEHVYYTLFFFYLFESEVSRITNSLLPRYKIRQICVSDMKAQSYVDTEQKECLSASHLREISWIQENISNVPSENRKKETSICLSIMDHFRLFQTYNGMLLFTLKKWL